nr:hypothetical protein [Pantoea agglomerans]
MTTIFAQNLMFAAADQLWTDINDLPAPSPFFKYYVLDDIILFYSGDIQPILSVLAGYVTCLGIDTEYAEKMAELADIENTECEYFEMDRVSGEIIHSVKATEHFLDDQFFCGIGSGAHHALRRYIDSLAIMECSGHQFSFENHGLNLVNDSMYFAFREDVCSGGEVFHAHLDGSELNIERLCWPGKSEISNYNNKILSKIDEHFVSKEAVLELLTLLLTEEKDDQREFDMEAKAFDQSVEQEYNQPTSVKAKGRSAMSNTTDTPMRVAVKTSGSGRGKPFSAAELKARLEQRRNAG